MPDSLTLPQVVFSPRRFGISEQECTLGFPSDRFFDGSQQQLYRGITIRASKYLVYAWLCQMRRAPYSYDWIDNLGRKSPRERDESLVAVQPDDRFMYIFTISEYQCESFLSLTTTIARRCLSRLYIDYMIVDSAEENSVRLLVKLNIKYASGLPGACLKMLLPLGDGIMMAKQLNTFRKYAEEDARQT